MSRVIALPNVNQGLLDSDEVANNLALRLEEADIQSLLSIDAPFVTNVTDIISRYEQAGVFGLGMEPTTNALRKEILREVQANINNRHLLRRSHLERAVQRQLGLMRLVATWQISTLTGSEALSVLPPLQSVANSGIDIDLELASAYASLTNRVTNLLTSAAVTAVTPAKLRSQLTATLSGTKYGAFKSSMALAGRQSAAVARTVSTEAVYRYNNDSVAGYLWVTARDERVCPICSTLHGIFYPLDGGDAPMERPPAHRMCRCAMVPVLKKELGNVDPEWPEFNDWADAVGLDAEFYNLGVA